VLFKRFADVDVFDLEVNSRDPEDVIEETLKKTMKIPVFHDDQHGTAIISGAALLNALEIVGKPIDKVHVVFNGAGAPGIACAEHYVKLGVWRESITLCDTKGVVYEGRTAGMNLYKQRFAKPTSLRTLAEAVVGADVLVGCSVKGAISADMIRSMGARPVVFAMANPDPEITCEEAKASREDVIFATGRSDYPNQVNNVLGFPFIFRGALDVRATAIDEEMKLAATRALADLAKEDVPDSVCRAYGVERLKFGPEYLIPKPFDPRVLLWETVAVARAAVESGVAQEPVDLDTYREQLERRLGKAHEIARIMVHKAQSHPKHVVFPQGDNEKILRACHTLVEENIAIPILLGNAGLIERKINELALDLKGGRTVDPADSPRRESYVEELFRLRQRRGVTLTEARTLIDNRTIFGSITLHMGDADKPVSGVTQHFPDTLRPALQIVRVREGLHKVSGCCAMITCKGEVYFLADTSVNIELAAEDLVEIALCTAQTARRFDLEPRVAMLSFSSFGSTNHLHSEKVRRAVELLHRADPTLMVDGELMADDAISGELEQNYTFS